MAGQKVTPKWRPPLAWIVFAVLLTVLSLPAAIVIGFRALDETQSRIGAVEFGALAVAFLITLLIAGLFSRTITGPINALIRTTQEIAQGRRSAITAPKQHGTRELAVLSQSFLDLAERLVERTEYVHSFASHVSHELKSPLTSIRGSAELLLHTKMSAAERRRFLEHIVADSERLAALLERLRELARSEVPLEAKGVTVRQVADQLQLRVPALQMAASGDVDAALALSPEAAMIAFGHLADNAIHHGASELRITVAGEGNELRLIVADDGSGIAEGNRERIFEPFFTTRRESGGTGMGLGIARSMLQAHGGTISIAPSEQGAAFELRIPRLPGD
jgi:signal transduction histidine kinase